MKVITQIRKETNEQTQGLRIRARDLASTDFSLFIDKRVTLKGEGIHNVTIPAFSHLEVKQTAENKYAIRPFSRNGGSKEPVAASDWISNIPQGKTITLYYAEPNSIKPPLSPAITVDAGTLHQAEPLQHYRNDDIKLRDSTKIAAELNRMKGPLRLTVQEIAKIQELIPEEGRHATYGLKENEPTNHYLNLTSTRANGHYIILNRTDGESITIDLGYAKMIEATKISADELTSQSNRI